MNIRILTAVLTLSAVVAVRAQHQGHDPAGAHGASVMGFSQTETSHHFRLSPSGGAIEVHINDAKNAALKEKVVMHLRMIAAQFAKGDFRTAAAVHNAAPDGTDAMSAARDRIAYELEEGPLGGRIFISTKDAAARDAVHAFLRYQIKEHRTGDSLRILN